MRVVMRRNFLLPLFIAAVIFSFSGLVCYADTLLLEDGRKIEGLILAEQQNYYIVKVKIGTVKIDKATVEEINRLSTEENFFVFGNQFFDIANYDAAMDEYKKALDVNPGFQPAKDAIVKVEKIKKEIEENRRRELEIKKKEFMQKQEIMVTTFGFYLDSIDGWVTVTSLNSDGKGKEGGLKENDRIIYVDTQQMKDLSIEEVIDYLTKKGEETHTFIIQREVEVIRKTITYHNHTFIGIGIFLDVNGGKLTISNVIPVGPADMAGLRVKDEIVSIDEKQTKGMPVSAAAELINGEEFSTVTIVIQRGIKI